VEQIFTVDSLLFLLKILSFVCYWILKALLLGLEML